MRCVLTAVMLLLLCSTALAQNYVGDQACSGCHANNPSTGFFEGYMNSGHPWKIFRTEGNTPGEDTWPHTPVPPLPVANTNQLEWSDVEYVIGNYYWKARYIDPRGYIYTGEVGETTQWNLLTEEWVPYNAGTVDKPFDCGRCHTTGYDATGNQHGLEGLIGTWTEDGVRCEACHGPGGDHILDPSGTPPPGGKDCSECHYRDAAFRMPWSGGFMRHHQQSEDLSHSAHKDVHTCLTCHDPHRSVVYEDGGTTTTCSQCHPGDESNSFYLVEGMENIECIDCHMPFMGKSGQSFNDHTGDIRGHLFQIMADTTRAEFNVTEIEGSLYWNQDENDFGYVTLDYACQGCHEEIGSPITMEAAAAYADSIHYRHPSPVELAWFDVAQQDGAVLVSWKTSMEADHAGFNVLRAEEPVGLLDQLNDELIREPSRSGRVYEFTDGDVVAGRTYRYELEAVDLTGATERFEMGVIRVGKAVLPPLALHQNHPNPFNPSTSITFDLPATTNVTLRIYDAQGRPIRTLVEGKLGADSHVFEWDGRDDVGRSQASGIYLYRLEAGEQTLSRKLVMLR